MPNEKPRFSVAIRSDAYQKLINDTLGDKQVAQQFVADISTVVAQNRMLSRCDAGSILSAGLVAQTLKLPLSQTLGFAYVIPYGDKAQFQVGWKGLVQLAIRSGCYETLGVREVHKGEACGYDEFGEEVIKFDHKFDNDEVVGYYAYFKLTTGFKKTLYWTKEQCQQHARKYSKSYGNGSSSDNWTNMFSQMACKTVLKQLLSKYGIQSVEIQKAIQADQSVVQEDGTFEYVDNVPTERKSSVKNIEDDGVVDLTEDENERF